MRRSGSLSLVVIVVLAVGWLTYTLTLGGHSPQLGLDLQGGTSVVLAPRGASRSDATRPSDLDHPPTRRRPRRGRTGDHPPGQLHRGVAARRQGPRPRHRRSSARPRSCSSGRTAASCRPAFPTTSTSRRSSPTAPYGSCVAPNGSAPSTTAHRRSEQRSGRAAAPASTPGHRVEPERPRLATARPSECGQAPATTDTTAPAHDHDGTGEHDTDGAGRPRPRAEPTTPAPANPLPCGAAGDRASTTPDDQPHRRRRTTRTRTARSTVARCSARPRSTAPRCRTRRPPSRRARGSSS